MIVVLKVETIEVPGDIYEHGDFGEQKAYAYRPGDVPEERSYKREFIQGRLFVDEKGNRFTIGMTSEVRETLGVLFDVMESMGVAIERYRAERVGLISNINRYQAYISKLGRTGFWKRLKFLFTGITIEKNQGEVE